jgi:hypothetical protein
MERGTVIGSPLGPILSPGKHVGDNSDSPPEKREVRSCLTATMTATTAIVNALTQP